MQQTMDETQRRRKKQIEYNYEHQITPRKAGKKDLIQPMMSGIEVTVDGKLVKAYTDPEDISLAADPVVQYMSADDLKKQIAKLKSSMVKAAKELNFVEAARLRDEMYALEQMLKNKEQ